jgi:signal transduction histidine kinase/ActR/RegA family two-component response regulator
MYCIRQHGDLTSLAKDLNTDIGVVILTEEALLGDITLLERVLGQQPAWSDIPFILLASSQNRAGRGTDFVRQRLPANATNVVVLERPLSSASLLSAVAAAWRSRERQFDMRDRLAELAEERSRLQTLLENLPVGVCFMDREGRSLISNPSYDQWVPNGQIPSQQASEVQRWVAVDSQGRMLPPEQYPGARALRGEVVRGQDFCYSLDKTSESWLRVSSVPLYDADGQIIGATTVIADINDEKRAELALRRFNEELEIKVQARTRELAAALEQLQKESAERERAEDQLRHSLKMEAVGQLTGGIAHDFNNMLTGVLGALDLIKLRAKGRLDGLERYMDAAQVSAQRAAALTQRLLAFSRRQSLESRPMSVNQLIIALHDLLRRSIAEQITLQLDLAEDLPWAIADANQLENAILNLVINARDAMPAGGHITIVTHAITVASPSENPDALAPGHYVCIEVKDTGSGIPARLMDKVLEPFFTTKPQGQGTGLGLSMVYGFARQSKGRLHIDSLPEKGTTVSICLPAAQSEPAIPAAEPRELMEGAGQTILLVEDDDSVRLFNQEALEELGYQVRVARDGQEALVLLEQMPHLDLLVTDVGLPGMNGRQLAEVIQQLRPRLPVLFLTGYAEGAMSRTEFLGRNMQLITKPFTLDILAMRVAMILQQQDVPVE